MRHIILLSVASPALQYFSRYHKTGMIFQKKKKKRLKIKLSWFSLQLLSEKFPTERRNQQDTIIKTLFLSDCVGNSILSTDFEKKKKPKYRTATTSV
jgi:hypothetical protein